MHPWVQLAGIGLLLSACAADVVPAADEDAVVAPPPEQPTAAPPIDSAITLAVAGIDGWNYHQAATTDLDGDGVEEMVVLMARVDVVRGRPAWDDGQAWQVYVESAEGHRTYLYAQRLQLGTLTMRIGTEPQGTVVLLEHLPDRIRLFDAIYRGPDAATVTVKYQRQLDPRGEISAPRYPAQSSPR